MMKKLVSGNLHLCLHNLTAKPVDLLSDVMFKGKRNDMVIERIIHGLVHSVKGQAALIDQRSIILGKQVVSQFS